LDHVSLASDPSRIEEMGFALTPTPGATGHARVHLDGAYLEVRPSPSDEVAAGGWFLRPRDLEGAAALLRRAGLPVTGPTLFEGADGSWLDLAAAGTQSPALPILTKRLDPPTGGWPPPLADSHANGVTRLHEIHIRSKEPALLITMLEVLGAERAGDAMLTLAGGGRVAVETGRDPLEGIAALVFERAEAPPLTLTLNPAD
jgi:hypothetical protein